MASRALRVLEIIAGFAVEGPLGGAERFGIELVKALPQDIEPVLLGMWAFGTPTENGWRRQVEAAGVQALMAAPWDESAPTRSFVAALRGAHAALAGQRFDIIHSHCQFGDPLALLLQRRLRAPVLVRTVHNEREWGRRPLRRLLMTHGLALSAFQAEIGVSAQIVSNLDRRPVARLLGRRASLIHNAIQIERFAQPITEAVRATARASLGLTPDTLCIGSVGRLDPQKGYPVLLDAMREVVARVPTAHLLLAGDGALSAALHEQVAHSPVAAHLHLLGPVTPIEPFFSALDLFVSSSLYEGLATVLLEAIAAQVPVVGTRISGTTELIEDGRSGWLAPPGDAATLAATIVAALSDPRERRARADAAYPILSRFDIDDVAARYADLYRRFKR